MKEQIGTLQVTGTGTVQVAPDEAIVHLVVITEARTAAEAVASNAKRAQATIDAVSAQPNHGVTTTGPSVSPILKYDSNVTTIVGFRATNGVEVRTKVGYAAQIYDAGIAAGANESSGITFRVQNERPHREEALRIAVDEAFNEARIVAKAANVELDGPEAIQINATGGPVFHRTEALQAMAAPTPSIPGELSITASVQILFHTRR